MLVHFLLKLFVPLIFLPLKAILIDVDSTGGYPVAGEEISVAIKNSKKPVVALIREQGDSAAY